MGSESNPLRMAVGQALAHELREAAATIVHCVNQLDETQLWWRPAASMNSVANLMLHLCGNVRQWIIAGLGGAEDIRNRPLEFSERGPVPVDGLLGQLKATVEEAADVIEAASAEDLQRMKAIQGYQTNGIGAVVHSVSHFRGHVQEIVHLTRLQRGDDYVFAIVLDAEQGGTS